MKSEDDNLELYKLKLSVLSEEFDSEMTKLGSQPLSRAESNITSGHILGDSIMIKGFLNQFSVNVELFNGDKIRLRMLEFTGVTSST